MLTSSSLSPSSDAYISSIGFLDLSLRQLPSSQIQEVSTCLFKLLPPVKKLVTKPAVGEPGIHQCDQDFFEYDMTLLGKHIRYGNAVTLVHTLSNKILTPRFDTGAKKENSRVVTLTANPDTSECRGMILPYSNLNRFGDSVDVTAPLLFIFKDSNQIHYNLSVDETDQAALVVGLDEVRWNVRKYSLFDHQENMSVRYGSLVTLSNRKLGMWLTASPLYDKQYDFVPDLQTQEAELQEGSGVSLPSVFTHTFKASLTYEFRDYNVYWVFEREDRFVGGRVTKGDKFWLKHAASEKYLGPNGFLLDTPSPDFTFSIPQLEKEDQDLGIMFNELIEVVTSTGDMLVADKDRSEKYIWSALFAKQMELHEQYRDQIYQPVEFRKTGARVGDASFEVSQPEKFLADTFSMFLCLREKLSVLRLFYRRVDALAKAELSNKDANPSLLSTPNIDEKQALAEFIAQKLRNASSDLHMKTIQSSLFALGYHLEMMEIVYLSHLKVGQDQLFTLQGLDPESVETARSKFRANDNLAGVNNLFRGEVIDLLMKDNQFTSMRFLEDRHFVPYLKERDPVELTNYLKVAFEVETPGMQDFFSYLFLFESMMKPLTQTPEKSDCDLIDTFASLCHKLEGSVLDVNPTELLMYQDQEGAKVPIVRFNGDSEAPGINVFGFDIAFVSKRPRMSIAFTRGVEYSVHIATLINAVCTISPGGHIQLAQTLNLAPDFLKQCILHPALNMNLRLKLISIYNHLFLPGEERKETVIEKMKLMCFVEADAHFEDTQELNPLQTAATVQVTEVARETIQSEFFFWLASEPDSILVKIMNEPLSYEERASLSLAYIRSHIDAVSTLINWRYVNDTFVCCIEQMAITLLSAFDEMKKEEEMPAHWSTETMRFIFAMPKQKKDEAHLQSAAVAQVEVDLAIQDTFHAVLRLYELIFKWHQFNVTKKTLRKVVVDQEWKRLLNEDQLSDVVGIKLRNYFSPLLNANCRESVLRSFAQSVSTPVSGTSDSTVPLMSSVSGSTALISSVTLTVLLKPWNLQELLLKLLIESNKVSNKYSKLLIKLLGEVTNPADTFLKHLHKALFVEDQSLASIQSMVDVFSHCKLELRDLLKNKDPETLSGLQTLVSGVDIFCQLLTTLHKSGTVFHKVQTVLANFGMLNLLKELWDLSTLLDENKRSDCVLTVQLKTLTLYLTRKFSHGDKHLEAQVVTLMHKDNFFIDFPEYVELLGDLKLLKTASHDVIYLSTEILLDKMKSHPQNSDRIVESVLRLMHEGDSIIPENVLLVTAVASPALKQLLAADQPDLHLISLLLKIVRNAATYSLPLVQNMRYLYPNEKLVAAKLSESARADIISSVLQFLSTTSIDEKKKEPVSGFDASAWYSPVADILKRVDVAALSEAIGTGLIRVSNTEHSSVTVRCNENIHSGYNESMAVAKFLYHLDRHGAEHGLLVDYPLLYAVGIQAGSGSEAFEGLRNVLDLLYRLYNTVSAAVSEKPELAPLGKVFCVALQALDSYIDTNISSLGGVDALNELLASFRPTLAAGAPEPPAGLQRSFASPPIFNIRKDLEEDLTSFLKVSTHFITPENVNAVTLFSSHFQAKTGITDETVTMPPGAIEKFTELSEKTQKIFLASRDPQTYLTIKGQVIQSWKNEVRMEFNNTYWDTSLLEQAVNYSIRSPDVKVRISALVTLNSILAGQSTEFRSRILAYLRERQRYFILFASFKRGVERFLRTYNKKHLKDSAVHSREQEEALNFALYLEQFLIFFQHCCDVCFTKFQHFLRTQTAEESTSNFNIIEEIGNFVIALSELRLDDTIMDETVMKVTSAALQALVEGISGPCNENQLVLGQNPKLYRALNVFIKHCQDKVEVSTNLHQAVLNLLKALLEGHVDQTKYIQTHMSKYLDTSLMLRGLQRIYKEQLHAKETDLALDLADPNSKTLFNIYIQQMTVLLHISKQTKVPVLAMRSPEDIQRETDLSLEQCLLFYLNFIGAVEIMFEEKIYDAIFPIPVRAKFLTQETQAQIMDEIKRGSQQEKIDDFISKVPICEEEMKHQQYISQFRLLKAVSKHWNTLSHLSFTLIVLINVLLLLGITSDGEKRFNLGTTASVVLDVFGSVQVVVMVVCRVLYWIEFWHTLYYPISTDDEGWNTKQLYETPESNSQVMVIRTAQLAAASDSEKSTVKLDVPTLTQLIWHVVYTVLCFIALLLWPEIYPVLLLDVINHNENLVNILKAVTLNGQQLILTALFSLTMVYIFSVWSYFLFYNYYTPSGNMYCDSLFSCFFSTLNIGVRTGSIGEDPYEAQDYSWRMLYDFLFFVIIIVILLNIVFGIIIDTFGQLRDDRNAVEEDINSICFICGEDRSLIDLHGEGWVEHIMTVHSPFAYLAFMIYVKEKKTEDCSGLEKYVQEQLKDNDSAFIPNTSQVLMRKGKVNSA